MKAIYMGPARAVLFSGGGWGQLQPGMEVEIRTMYGSVAEIYHSMNGGAVLTVPIDQLEAVSGE